MHTFQDMPVEMIEMNPFTMIGQEFALLTAEKDGKANSMTISWGGVGELWGKHVVTIYVRESRYTKELIDASDTFSVSFFQGKEMNSLKYFGAVSGRNEDKYKATGFNVNHHKGIPFIDECHFAIVCKKMAEVPILDENFLDRNIHDQFYAEGDYHTMYIGEVVDFLAR
ncbi:MAG: flavin reductase family protein [Lachnospiraceae bacterium]|jgi:flavin reductase (DIM6/NTAB) family NADH-FMN oxidoreductase RutF|nr:flavin reductase family protein [Lachnospiraceae bacterium]